MKTGRTLVAISLIVFSIYMIDASPCAGYNYLGNCVETSFDNATAYVNNSQFLQGLTPQQVADLFNELDPKWNANYSNFLLVSAWNDTGLIKDWNATGYIQNWSAIISGGSSVSFGTDNQIPYTNAGGDDFDYSSFFTYDNSLVRLLVGSMFMRDFSNTTEYIEDDFDTDYNPLSDDADWTFKSTEENLKALNGDLELITDAYAGVYTPAVRYYIYDGKNPATADYYIELNETISWASNNPAQGRIYGRWIDANNYYMLYYEIMREASGGGDIYLYVVKDGVYTLLDSVDDGIAHPDTGTKQVVLTLRMEGDSISGLVDGVEKVSATDGNLTMKGQAGMGHRDSYSTTANSNFYIHSFSVFNTEGIGQIGTDSDMDWFAIRNDLPIFQVQDDGIIFLEGNKITLRDENSLYESTLQQMPQDYFHIGGTSTRLDNQLSAGSISNNLLEFKSFTYDDENLYVELFNIDYDPFSDNPLWDKLDMSTATEYTETTGGKLWTSNTYNQYNDYYYLYSTEMTTNNYTVEVDIGAGWNGNNYGVGGVIARYEDDDNHWRCRVMALRGASGGADLDLIRVVGGTETIVNESHLVTGDPSNPYTGNVKLVVEGDKYYCYFGDVLELTYTDGENMTDATKVGAVVRKSRYTTEASYIDNWKAYITGEYSIIGTVTDTPLRFKTSEVEWWEFGTDGNFDSIFDTNITTGTTTITSGELIVDKITATTTDPLMLVYTPTTFDRIKRLDSVVPSDKKGLNFWYDSSDPDNLQAWNSLTGDTYTIAMKKGKNKVSIEIKEGYFYDYLLDQYYKIESKSVEVDLSDVSEDVMSKYLRKITECRIQKKEICNIKMDVKVYVSDNEALK